MSGYSIKQIAEAFGKSPDTIQRRIAAGEWPEAAKVDSTYGERWEVPVATLPHIANREGWVLDLRTADAVAEHHPQPVLEALRAEHAASIERLTAERSAEQQARKDAERKIETHKSELAAIIREHKAETDELQAAILDLTGQKATAQAAADERAATIERQAVSLDQAHAERIELGKRLEFERLGWLAKRRQRRNEG